MASTSQYASTPNVGSANITAALTGTRTTPSGASTLITAGASGSIVFRAVIQNISPEAALAPTANVARFYLHDGSNYYLVKEYGFTATNATATAASPPFEVPFNDLVIPTGWSLRVGLATMGGANVDDTCITAFGGDF